MSILKQCDRCGIDESNSPSQGNWRTLHDQWAPNDFTVERHLCRDCAQAFTRFLSEIHPVKQIIDGYGNVKAEVKV